MTYVQVQREEMQQYIDIVRWQGIASLSMYYTVTALCQASIAAVYGVQEILANRNSLIRIRG